jgi:hypothetical protein
MRAPRREVGSNSGPAPSRPASGQRSPSLGERFAIDFSARLDANGRAHVGDPDRNASYFNYGRPVLAVGVGTVVEVVDDLPDQVPNHMIPIPTAGQDGNHVDSKSILGSSWDTGTFGPEA